MLIKSNNKAFLKKIKPVDDYVAIGWKKPHYAQVIHVAAFSVFSIESIVRKVNKRGK